MAKESFSGIVKAGGQRMKTNVTWKQALKSFIKQTIGAVLTSTADQMANKQMPE